MQEKYLVINAGSSSLKFSLFDAETEKELVNGYVEKIGNPDSFYTLKFNEQKIKKETEIKNHVQAIDCMLTELIDNGFVTNINEIVGVGHRVLHGGEFYGNSVVIDEEVLENIDMLTKLGPLHHPGELSGIRSIEACIPGVTQVAVFDTAFHQTMPPESYIYALPYEYYEKYGVRRYGFHGTSHKYVSERAADMLNVNLDDLKLITCHLGNGASVSAIKRGKCIDTSMGFTPLEGLVMGTRSGDIDPAIVTFIREKEGLEPGVANEILNKKSGVLGISGVSSDFRDIEAAAEEGNERAMLALKVFAHKVRFYIGAYIAEMNGVDAIVFTAGVGENDISMRDIICNDLGNLGIKLDVVKNKVRGKEMIISREDSKVKVLLIPTNEELMIARDTFNIVTKGQA